MADSSAALQHKIS